jgi:hypothetical protein
LVFEIDLLKYILVSGTYYVNHYSLPLHVTYNSVIYMNMACELASSEKHQIEKVVSL